MAQNILVNAVSFTTKLLPEITKCLVDEMCPEQIILFGSYAWGTPNADSDVDLMVIVQEDHLTPIQRVMQARACLAQFPIPKDILVKKKSEFEFFLSVPSSLESLIAAKGKVLYERSATCFAFFNTPILKP